MQLAANLSTLFRDRPMVERFGAAAAAGFEWGEIQFPHLHNLKELQQARDAAGLEIALINVPAGDPEQGELGLAALPGREADFREAVETALVYARGLGARKVNVLAGRPPAEAAPEVIWASFITNLRYAADRFGAGGVRVQIEPINPLDVPGFFLSSLAMALEALERAAHENLQIQLDLYHMAVTEPSLKEAILRCGTAVGHVQFADHPGRHEPGSGSLDLLAALTDLRAAGYDDIAAAEYIPSGRAEESFHWLPDFRTALA